MSIAFLLDKAVYMVYTLTMEQEKYSNKRPSWIAIFLGPAKELSTIELEWALAMGRVYRAERAKKAMPLAA